MMIFIRRRESIIAFPSSQIILVEQIKNEIHISYHSGYFKSEKFRANNNSESTGSIFENYDDVACEKLVYNNVKEVLLELKSFYIAIATNKRVFSFNVVSPGYALAKKNTKKNPDKNPGKKQVPVNTANKPDLMKDIVQAQTLLQVLENQKGVK